METDLTEERLSQLSRKELQALCKERQLRANLSTAMLRESLLTYSNETKRGSLDLHVIRQQYEQMPDGNSDSDDDHPRHASTVRNASPGPGIMMSASRLLRSMSRRGPHSPPRTSRTTPKNTRTSRRRSLPRRALDALMGAEEIKEHDNEVHQGKEAKDDEEEDIEVSSAAKRELLQGPPRSLSPVSVRRSLSFANGGEEDEVAMSFPTDHSTNPFAASVTSNVSNPFLTGVGADIGTNRDAVNAPISASVVSDVGDATYALASTSTSTSSSSASEFGGVSGVIDHHLSSAHVSSVGLVPDLASQLGLNTNESAVLPGDIQNDEPQTARKGSGSSNPIAISNLSPAREGFFLPPSSTAVHFTGPSGSALSLGIPDDNAGAPRPKTPRSAWGLLSSLWQRSPRGTVSAVPPSTTPTSSDDQLGDKRKRVSSTDHNPKKSRFGLSPRFFNSDSPSNATHPSQSHSFDASSSSSSSSSPFVSASVSTAHTSTHPPKVAVFSPITQKFPPLAPLSPSLSVSLQPFAPEYLPLNPPTINSTSTNPPLTTIPLIAPIDPVHPVTAPASLPRKSRRSLISTIAAIPGFFSPFTFNRSPTSASAFASTSSAAAASTTFSIPLPPVSSVTSVPSFVSVSAPVSSIPSSSTSSAQHTSPMADHLSPFAPAPNVGGGIGSPSPSRRKTKLVFTHSPKSPNGVAVLQSVSTVPVHTHHAHNHHDHHRDHDGDGDNNMSAFSTSTTSNGDAAVATNGFHTTTSAGSGEDAPLFVAPPKRKLKYIITKGKKYNTPKASIGAASPALAPSSSLSSASSSLPNSASSSSTSSLFSTPSKGFGSLSSSSSQPSANTNIFSSSSSSLFSSSSSSSSFGGSGFPSFNSTFGSSSSTSTSTSTLTSTPFPSFASNGKSYGSSIYGSSIITFAELASQPSSSSASSSSSSSSTLSTSTPNKSNSFSTFSYPYTPAINGHSSSSSSSVVAGSTVKQFSTSFSPALFSFPTSPLAPSAPSTSAVSLSSAFDKEKDESSANALSPVRSTSPVMKVLRSGKKIGSSLRL